MRVKITALTRQSAIIPFNYNYALHSAIYALIEKSSSEYSRYLHDRGFINQAVNKRFKLFTFSKLLFTRARIRKNGFFDVKEISFVFSTPIEQSYEHLILGLFSDQTFHLNFTGKKINFSVTRVEAKPEVPFNNECKFICLSPIAVSTQREKANGRLEQHYLDYMNPEEREHFVENIKKNLINKYQTFHKTDYTNHSHEFKFSFDVNYIAKRQGKISKLIHFKKIDNNIRTKIKGFEAPFQIIADPELIKIGYAAGFGNDNSAGMGCGKLYREVKK
jgi:CRISPR-associated endoribonuclease Cas6